MKTTLDQSAAFNEVSDSRKLEAQGLLAATACYATGQHVANLTMPYVFWRFQYWLKVKDMTYTQIDEAVNRGKLVPCDCMVA
jgi:hypothetical protein